MEKKSRILVTGCQGMTGSALVRSLHKSGFTNVIGIDRVDCDLTNQGLVNMNFVRYRPEYVFHVAAKVGGIHANDTQSADFIYENLMMQSNVMEVCRDIEVKKLIFCGSACIYPKDTKMPIKEEYLLTGRMEQTNVAYAVAKIAGVTMCDMYRKQYGCNFISAMPTNLYGVGDNFHLKDSHVLPALIRKFHDGKMLRHGAVRVWGTGLPRREFLYCEDLADALIFLMDNYNEAGPINVGTGEDIAIKDIVEVIQNVVGYSGEVVWDREYPDGVYERRLDVSRINKLGWSAKTKLEDGIKKTYDWYVKNQVYARK